MLFRVICLAMSSLGLQHRIANGLLLARSEEVCKRHPRGPQVQLHEPTDNFSSLKTCIYGWQTYVPGIGVVVTVDVVWVVGVVTVRTKRVPGALEVPAGLWSSRRVFDLSEPLRAIMGPESQFASLTQPTNGRWAWSTRPWWTSRAPCRRSGPAWPPIFLNDYLSLPPPPCLVFNKHSKWVMGQFNLCN